MDMLLFAILGGKKCYINDCMSVMSAVYICIDLGKSCFTAGCTNRHEKGKSPSSTIFQWNQTGKQDRLQQYTRKNGGVN